MVFESDAAEAVEKKDIEMQTVENQPKYFITVSRRTGLRRLHAHFKCPVRSLRCLDSFDVAKVDESMFDVMCRICKRRLQVEEGLHESESSSTSGDSSSTDAENPVENGEYQDS